ncbi:MAG: DUF1697 domain-containing protein [Acidobacteriota bacterium]|jgi:uncharacterized protein (DUF1697 family)
MSRTCIALLRGINVGGKHKLPMAALRSIFEEAGCGEVRTYIQSGNVVFTAEPDLAARVPERIGREIEARFGFTSPVVTRSAAELAEVAASNPFVDPSVEEGVDEKALHVLFLRDAPAAAQVAALDPDRSPPDRYTVRGREVYLCCPQGVARTKLTTRYFDSRLETVSTLRNWRTVRKLLELAGGG